MKDTSIPLSDFDYPLKESQIALHPVSPRDSSKLLVYREGQISDLIFNKLPEVLPAGSTLFFNDTRVINARLFFRKESGAKIEILLLEASSPHETALAMAAKNICRWCCMIGNMKKWKSGKLSLSLKDGESVILLFANLIDRDKQEVEFTWNSKHTFSELLAITGSIPLPPYLKRPPEERDKSDYQTIYSKISGAVAAPTAGLHFTEQTLVDLKQRNIETHYVTLHVGAGTFKPVEVENIKEHPIHEEEIIIEKSTVQKIMTSALPIAVGTTSLRTLESIYWWGVQIKSKLPTDLLQKETPYTLEPLPKEEALRTVIEYLERLGKEKISIRTELYIYPGYTFHICQGLITNFHLPKSSLLMLVSAFVGPDWKSIYEHAIRNNYRFLSYGDSSLLLNISRNGP